MFEEIKNKYKIKSRRLISSYRDGYIGKDVYEVVLNDGTVKSVEQIIKNNRNGDAVVIIPITDENRFVVIIEARPNIYEEVTLGFPAGMVDDEKYEEAAIRELEEETGYTSDKLIELEWHYQDQGCSKAIIKTFVALNCKKIKEQQLDSEEAITAIEVDEDELDNIAQEEFKGANPKIAYLIYKLRRNEIRKED